MFKISLKKNQPRSLCLMLLVITMGSKINPVTASSSDTINVIKKSVTEFLDVHYIQKKSDDFNQPSYEIMRLDPRLRLAACQNPLTVSSTQMDLKPGRVNLKAMCKEPSWSMHVPVKLTMKTKVVKAKQALLRNAMIQMADLEMDWVDAQRHHQGYFHSMEKLKGAVLKRNIIAGRVITPFLVQKPFLVKKDQSITILSQATNIQIKAVGKALSNARFGDVIKARNINSNRIVEGTVSQSGELLIRQ